MHELMRLLVVACSICQLPELPALPPRVCELCEDIMALPGWQILRVYLLYACICIFSLLVLLQYTPLGWQGYSVLSARSSPTYADHYAGMRQQLADALSAEAAWPQHESGSLAATTLPHWQMQLPPMPAKNALISPPLNAARTLPPYKKPAELGTPAAQTYSLGSTFRMVTWSGSASFARLQNLLGSVALWEPSQRVVVYDIGLSQAQLIQLQCTDNVLVRPFDFDAVDAHIHAASFSSPATDAASSSHPAPPPPLSAVRNLEQGQFKALLLWDALQHASAVLLVEAHMELRQPLAGVQALLRRDGALMVGVRTPPSGGEGAVARKLGRQTMPATMRQLGVAHTALDRDLCAGDLIGVVRASPLYDALATTAAQCALRSRQCWAPTGASFDTHRFGQSVFSILLAKAGLKCPRNRSLRELDLARCPLRHDRFWAEERGGPVFCVRRATSTWYPGPYAGEQRLLPGCKPAVVAAQPQQWMYRVALDASLAPELAVRAAEAAGQLMLPAPSTAEAEAALTRCMEAHQRQRKFCAREVARLHASREARPPLLHRLWFYKEQARTLLLAGLRMPSSYLLCGALAYGLLRLLEGASWMHRHRHPLLASWTALAIITLLAVIVADRDMEA